MTSEESNHGFIAEWELINNGSSCNNTNTNSNNNGKNNNNNNQVLAGLRVELKTMDSLIGFHS